MSPMTLFICILLLPILLLLSFSDNNTMFIYELLETLEFISWAISELFKTGPACKSIP